MDKGECIMDREQFFEWLNQYEGTYKFIEDDYGEVTIKFFVNEINEDDNDFEEIQESNTTFIDINDTGGKW